VFLSPYLRPFLADGRLLFDHPLGGEPVSLSPLQEAAVVALWDSGTAAPDLQELRDQHGGQSVEAALAELHRIGLLFDSESACEAALDRAMQTGQPDVPFIDQVEVTSVCPMRCGFCPRGIPGKVTRPKGHMDLALFERLLGQMHPAQASWRLLELHHLGESLVHPQLPRFVRAASERGIPTELSANPSLLTPELAHELLDAGIRRLVLSLDGIDEPTLTSIRGPAASFARAERHIEALLSQLVHRREPAQVVIQMLALERNAHQREAFLRRWATLGIPYVATFIKALEGPDPDTGQEKPAPGFLCTFPWRSVVVLWDGRVVPCCRDDDARVVLGDLNRQDLREIWEGPEVQRLRELHRSEAFEGSHPCEGCAWRRQRFAADRALRHPRRARANPLHW
jgi:radical SAM protein with 4Fe4S-binding SPASM domain